jgi:COP9 signalosome complex subunit 4
MVSISADLSALESATGHQRSAGYNDLLKRIVSSDQDLENNLVRYVQSITSDNVGVIVSRPLLSAFVEQFRALTDNSLKIEAG